MKQITVEMLKFSNASKLPTYVLTTEQAKERFINGKSLITHTLRDALTGAETWFFSNSHMYGYGVLPSAFVPTTAYLPMTVTPREQVPSGVVRTIEDFMAVFTEGRQLTTVEEVVDFVNNEYTSEPSVILGKNKSVVKKDYGPQFFPQGTIVEIDCSTIFKGQLTVDGIVKNGPNSYVLQMFETNENDIDKDKHAFHTVHVSKIVKRGEGKVKFITTHGDMHFPYRKSELFGNKKYYCASASDVLGILFKVNKVPVEFCVDFDNLERALRVNCSKKHIINANGNWVYKFNKKKAKKWFKQNLNRFLVSPSKAQEVDDRQMDAMMREDYMDDFLDIQVSELTDTLQRSSGISEFEPPVNYPAMDSV